MLQYVPVYSPSYPVTERIRVNFRTGKGRRAFRSTYSDGERERLKRRSKRPKRAHPTDSRRVANLTGDQLGTLPSGTASAIGSETGRSDPRISNADSENTFSNVQLLPKVLNIY